MKHLMFLNFSLLNVLSKVLFISWLVLSLLKSLFQRANKVDHIGIILALLGGSKGMELELGFAYLWTQEMEFQRLVFTKENPNTKWECEKTQNGSPKCSTRALPFARSEQRNQENSSLAWLQYSSRISKLSSLGLALSFLSGLLS